MITNVTKSANQTNQLTVSFDQKESEHWNIDVLMTQLINNPMSFTQMARQQSLMIIRKDETWKLGGMLSCFNYRMFH